ncbi:MAG TPA: endonuclease, partial [Castellaniella sp.]|nr:endonuclease [Castellaniella sp.]
PSIFPWLRLDRIYQRGFAVRRARVLHGAPWKRLSDHAPLVAELELP